MARYRIAGDILEAFAVELDDLPEDLDELSSEALKVKVAEELGLHIAADKMIEVQMWERIDENGASID